MSMLRGVERLEKIKRKLEADLIDISEKSRIIYRKLRFATNCRLNSEDEFSL